MTDTAGSCEVSLQPTRLVATGGHCKGTLPPNILVKLVEHHASYADLKALHLVNKAWREAVCQGLRVAKPTTCDLAMFKKFPKIERLIVEDIRFTEPRLAGLTQLKALALQQCKILHPMTDLSELRALQVLKLHDVKAISSVDLDSFLLHLTNLVELETTRTAANRTLPTLSGLASLSKLKELTVVNLEQQGPPPKLPQLSMLTQLTKITLQQVDVGYAALEGLSALTSLQSLKIPGCDKITNSAMPCFLPLTGLTKLNLRSQHRTEELTDVGIDCLSNLTNLQSLNLGGHKGLSSRGLGYLSTFTDLRELWLTDVPLWSGGADFLCNLTNLTTLDLSRSHLSAEQLAALGCLTKMEVLSVCESFLLPDGAPHIAQMKQLRVLDVSYTALMNGDFLLILEGCPRLTHLYADGCFVSTLCMLRTVKRRPHLKLWIKENKYLPNWMYKVDTVLIAQTAVYGRRLRILHVGEETLWMSAAVFMGVVSFFLLYFTLLFLVFLVIFLFPLALLGIACLLVGLFVASASVTSRIGKCLFHCVMSFGRLCCLSESIQVMEPAADRVEDAV